MARGRTITAGLTVFMVTSSMLATPAAASEPLGPPSELFDKKGAYACRQPTYEPPAGQHGHVASLAEAPNGDLLYSFDGNSFPLRPDPHRPSWNAKRSTLMRMEVGSRTWSKPEEIPYAEPESVHNGVLWNDGKGRIHKFFTTKYGWFHVDSTLDYRYSDDNGHTWSEPVRLREELGWMFGNRPLRMSNGEVIVPVYKEGSPHGVGFFISGDNFKTFEVHPAGDELWPGNGVGGLQAATVELEPGHLLAYMRTGADYVYETRSYDYGRTWTDATPTDLPNPWTRVDLLVLDSGNLLLAYNPSSSVRTPLRLALSEDGGETWSHEVDVETDPNFRYSYPYLLQTSDGWIHLGYSMREGANMGHVVFNEEFVRIGPDLESNHSDPTVEYRRGDLKEVEKCHYVRTRGKPSFGPPSGNGTASGA